MFSRRATPRGFSKYYRALQNSLSSGDVNGAQAAFRNLQNLNQGLAIASGGSLSSNSQVVYGSYGAWQRPECRQFDDGSVCVCYGEE